MIKRIDNKVFAREFLYFACTIILTLIISGVRELYYINKSENLEDLRVEYSEYNKTAHEYKKKKESQYLILKKIESATTQLQSNEYPYKVYKAMEDLYSDFNIPYNVFLRKINNRDTVNIVYNLLVKDKILTKSHDEFSNKLKEKFNIMDLSNYYGNDFYQLLLKKSNSNQLKEHYLKYEKTYKIANFDSYDKLKHFIDSNKFTESEIECSTSYPYLTKRKMIEKTSLLLKNRKSWLNYSFKVLMIIFFLTFILRYFVKSIIWSIKTLK